MPGMKFSLLALAGSALMLRTTGVEAELLEVPSQVAFPNVFNGTAPNPTCQYPLTASYFTSYQFFVPRAKPSAVWGDIGDPLNFDWTWLMTTYDEHYLRWVRLSEDSDPQNLVRQDSKLSPDTSESGTTMHYGVADNWAYYVTTSTNWAIKGSLQLLEVSVGECSPSLRTNTLERLAENSDYVQDNAPNAWTITRISFNISSCVWPEGPETGEVYMGELADGVTHGITSLYPDAKLTCQEALLAGTRNDEPSTDVPTTDEPTTDEPTTDEPTTDEPTTDEPTTDEPTTDEPTTDVPTTDEPTTDEPTTDEPTTDEPTTD
ncbi:hypothetical protein CAUPRSCDRAFT_13230, partial [Caulochytrium protostelioides]